MAGKVTPIAGEATQRRRLTSDLRQARDDGDVRARKTKSDDVT